MWIERKEKGPRVLEYGCTGWDDSPRFCGAIWMINRVLGYDFGRRFTNL